MPSTLRDATTLYTETLRITKKMKKSTDKCIDLICEIWNDYIYEKKWFQTRINFRDNDGSNYFGDIIHYLSDTSVVIQIDKIEKDDFYNSFSNAISFLQAIFVQQDLIEELLYIFTCSSNKGTLKQDQNYSLNRQIRNELVGHPIFKKVNPESSKRELLSSSIFSNDQNTSNIAYIRYHKKNNFDSEHIEHQRVEILNRHQIFLETYLEEICQKSVELLKRYKPKLLALLKTIDSAPIPNLVNCLEDIYENCFEYDYLHKPEHLLKLNQVKETHLRYKVSIDDFYYNLKNSVIETLNDINIYIGIDETYDPISKKAFFSQNLEKYSEGNGFHYELSKLVSKDDIAIILLRRRCSNFPLVIKEIDHMENNIDNEFEYYSSYRYLSCILKRRSDA